MLEDPQEVLANPELIRGKTPGEVERQIGGYPGWRIETLRRGSRRGAGWVLREYDVVGNSTGSVIRWHPGGGHHGSDPYWRVSSPRYGRSEEIR